MNIDAIQSVAVRRFAGADLRKAGIPDLDNFQPHTLSWAELNQCHRDLGKIAQGLADKLGDNANQADAAQLTAATDALLDMRQLCDGEKDHRTQQGSREARTSGGSPFRPISDGTANGGDDGSHSGETRAEVSIALAPEQRFADVVRKTSSQRNTGLTEGEFLRAALLGEGSNEAERRALSEGTDSAGGYTVPEILSAQMIDRLRAQSVVIRAGARTVPLTSDTNHYAKVATDPVPAWRAENAAVAEGDPTFSRITMTPRSLAVLVKCSRELLEDTLNLNTVLPDIIAKAMAAEVDRMALFGSGTAPEPQGLVNISGIGTYAMNDNIVGTGYRAFTRARTALLSANAPEPSAFILHPRDEGTYSDMQDGNGRYLDPPRAVANIPMLATTSVPINTGTGTNEGRIIGGYFPHMLLGIRNGLRIELLKERFADYMQVAFLAHLRATVAVEQPLSFHLTTGILPEA
jgi:HK97 family phage major capsid protein